MPQEKQAAGIDSKHRRVIFASSLGTVFEWYDFYLYGSLSAIISKQFFAGVNETTGFIFALLAFAAGFFVRPFGALLFGGLGDRLGRKYTFLITIVIMGSATALVGLLPTYATFGVAAPILLVLLRLAQGLALGGEYGGAATYVGEHAPPGKRGLYTSWIQTTATLGLFLSLLVILACRWILGAEAFEAWGWRIPFLLSIVLLGISVYIRLQLAESPIFEEMRREGTVSRTPLREAFGERGNLRLVAFALLGATAGQAVVWYTGQFYALFFLEKMLFVDSARANLIIAAALVLGTPLFIFFGALSDRVGRKKLVLGGCVLAAVLLFPIFRGLTHFANPQLAAAVGSAPITVIADPDDCSFQFDPVGRKTFSSSCDIAKAALARSGVPYANRAALPGSVASVEIGVTAMKDTTDAREPVNLTAFDGRDLAANDAAAFKARVAEFNSALKSELTKAGYPAKADPAQTNTLALILLCTALMVLVTMVYGPIAAWLVELFPARIRYSSMSLPYHIGNGWFGGFLPVTAFAIVAATGNIYAGLWYPVSIALLTAVVGALFLPESQPESRAKP
jgi:MFS family permease